MLAKCVEELKKHGKVNFDVKYIVMDPGYNELNRKKLNYDIEGDNEDYYGDRKRKFFRR